MTTSKTDTPSTGSTVDERPPVGSLEEHVEHPVERKTQRREEDRSFVPVIVKRVDQHRRHPDDVLLTAIAEGLEQLNRPALSLGLSSVAAGLILGFTAMAVGIMSVAVGPIESWPMASRILVSLVYPLGFIVCLMSGAELFTEHTATAVYPVLDRKATIAHLLRLWLIVISGNLVGASISAGLLTLAEPIIGATAGYIEVGRHLVEPSVPSLLISALLAGWLMALGAWLILANPPGLSQMVSIFIVTFLIGMGGLHHSIAGAVEMFVAYLVSDEFTLSESVRFILLALAGNLIGGSVFVAMLNYAHIRELQRDGEPEERTAQ